MKNLLIKAIKSIPAICIFLILVTLTMVLIGCTEQPPLNQIPLTPTENILKAMESTNWLVTIGILGIGISVFAMFQGWKQAVPTALGFITILVLALTVARWGIVIGFGGLILLGGYVGYNFFVRGKALKEVVNTVTYLQGVSETNNSEQTKDTIKEKVQSPSTTKIVSGIKGDKR